MMQTSKPLLVVLVACLMFHSPIAAQIRANYHFGLIGATGDTSVKLSAPVIIQYNKCFEITNGLIRFNQPKYGVFSIACYEAPPTIQLVVNAFPNPVVRELTIRSLVSYPEKGNARYSVMLTDHMGRPIREIKTDLPSINAGFRIPVHDLPLGYFIVTLYADKERIQSFKILKAA